MRRRLLDEADAVQERREKVFRVKTDRAVLCFRYFRVMTDELRIDPTPATFATLLASCKSRGDVALAEHYWNAMRSSFNIDADSAT